MAQDVTSSAAAYCSASELFEFIDSRQVAAMLRDTDTGDLASEADMIDTGAAVGARLRKLLRSGSGEVEAACLPRGQYAVADLEAIYASDTNASYHLKRVTAGCAILALFGRRHNASGARPEDYIAVAHAKEALERLRTGEHVFGLVQNIDAGKGASAIEFVDRTGESGTRVVNVAQRFFGRRARGGY